MIVNDEAAHSVIYDFWNGAAIIGNHWCAACHCLNHDEAEWLRPIDRDQQSDCATQELRLGAIIDLADQFDARSVDHRSDDLLEIRFVHSVHLCGDLQWYAGFAGDANSAVGALFGTNAAKKRQVSGLNSLRGEQIDGKAVMNGRHEVGLRQ